MFLVAAFIAAVSVLMLANAHQEVGKMPIHDSQPAIAETSDATAPLDISAEASPIKIEPVEPVEGVPSLIESVEIENVVEPEPRLFEIPMNMNDDVRRRVECANGKVSSCEGVRIRNLPSN